MYEEKGVITGLEMVIGYPILIVPQMLLQGVALLMGILLAIVLYPLAVFGAFIDPTLP